MLTATLAAASDPSTPWYITLLATAGPVIGVLVGVLVDPLKNVFARRERRRQELVELCRRLVEAAATVGHLAVGLNIAERAKNRGGPPPFEQRFEVMRTYNAAIAEMNVARQLIRMSGPDELSNSAGDVLDTCHRLQHQIHTPDDDPDATLTTLPRSVDQATEELLAATTRFSRLARNLTR